MKAMRRFWYSTTGSAFSMFFILIALFAFGLLFAEYLRFIDHHEEAENIIQRGINVSLEDLLRDSQRWDYETMVDTTKLWLRFDQFLRTEANWQGSYPVYRRVAPDGSTVWRIEFTNRSTTSAVNPYAVVEGSMVMTSALQFLPGEFSFPFMVRSRAFRLD